MNRVVIGIVLLLVIVGGVIALDRIGFDSFTRTKRPDAISVKFLVGGESPNLSGIPKW